MLQLPKLSFWILAGISPLLWLPVIPPLWFALILICAGGWVLCRTHHMVWRYCACGALALSWALVHAQSALITMAEMSGKRESMVVQITSTQGERHHGKIVQWRGKKRQFPPGVILYGKLPESQPCSGQLWQVSSTLRAVHGQYNAGGYSRQRAAMASGFVLSGRMADVQLIKASCSRRATLIRRVEQQTAHLAWGAVIHALAFGERGNMQAGVRQILRETGTAHLMAISGLHIAQAGGAGWLLARLIQFFLPAHWIRPSFPIIASIACAAGYTWLSGGNPPAVRSLIALGTWGVIRLYQRHWGAWDVLVVCLACVVLFDPLTLLSDSFWLSAFAVSALIFWCQWLPFYGVKKYRAAHFCAALVHLQLGACLLLLPLQVPLFHGISFTSLPANLIAVPMVTFLVVPLIFLGVLADSVLANSVLAPGLIWQCVDTLLAALFWVLAGLPKGWLPVDWRMSTISFLPWCMLVIMRFHWLRTSPFTCAALVAVLCAPWWLRHHHNGWQVHMLDIGHGLAMVIERNGYAFLYDTGNRWEGGNTGQQVILPWLAWHNLVPEGVVISHEHTDHNGGLASIQAQWPGITQWHNTPRAGGRHCYQGKQWQWQGLSFDVVWPPLQYQGSENNRSCVVLVSDGIHRVLLTGDLELPAELLLTKHPAYMKADVVQVPHHGSKSSSGIRFVGRAEGSVALASVARYNPWNMPSPAVIERYQQHSYQWYDTALHGQVSVSFSSTGWRISAHRARFFTPWYQRWFGVRPDNR